LHGVYDRFVIRHGFGLQEEKSSNGEKKRKQNPTGENPSQGTVDFLSGSAAE
jgi:hypothetical protein